MSALVFAAEDVTKVLAAVDRPPVNRRSAHDAAVLCNDFRTTLEDIDSLPTLVVRLGQEADQRIRAEHLGPAKVSAVTSAV